jgi:hypothetical protein
LRQRHCERGADSGRDFGRRALLQHRRERGRSAGADRRDVETHDGGQQEADIGEHGEAPADARIVLEHGDAMLVEERTQAAALAALGRFSEAEE